MEKEKFENINIEGSAQGAANGEEQKPHKRRPHYSGTHPRSYKEKYKELNPEKYGDTIVKVKQKGSTPAGMHISVMVKEVLDALQIQPGMIGLDGTLGYGGHSSAMMKELQGQGHLYSLDLDPIEMAKTKARLNENGFGDDIFTPIHMNFANLAEVASQHGPFDFLMADLGVSSMQIDNPERGFSYKLDGPLDLRMDPTKGESAAQRLASLEEDELISILIENSDEPYAEELAAAIRKHFWKGGKIDTTTDLRNIIDEVLEKIWAQNSKKGYNISKEDKKEEEKKTCQRVFQALRIEVNSEFDNLYSFLEALPHAMKSGGRIAILTFHSGEDRLVKKAFKAGQKAGIYSEISEEVIRPSREECFVNPRARSTKLRFAKKA